MKKSAVRVCLFCIFGIVATLFLEKFTDIDTDFQNFFFNSNTQLWTITKPMHQQLTWVFYKGFKFAVGIFAGTVFAMIFINRYSRIRMRLIIVFLSILLVPAIISGLKKYTNVHTPAELEMYGGKYPYVRIIDRDNTFAINGKKGRGFPAGHSTAGFLFMSLYYLARKKRVKKICLITGISLGWILGFYQILRGEHFVSHTFVSMFAAWIIIVIIANSSVAIRKKL